MMGPGLPIPDWRRLAVRCLLVCMFLLPAFPAVPGEPGAKAVPAKRDGTVVLSGIDVLQGGGFGQLEGRAVGLITNQTGIDRERNATYRLLYDAPNVNLVALFSPEHGFRGALDTARIGDSTDPATGLRIYSLYGETREPTADMLEGIDTLVFDIQDIGTRFYTYISTMGLAMRAAAEHGVEFIVLDRPNPVNGLTVSGPVLDEGRQSFTGFHRLPVRHGMTVGELAQMFRIELALDLDLKVIPVSGWKRAMHFDETGLPWVNPSPNIRSLAQAINYPGIGLLESSNISVGRGTDTPFEHIGAPWLEGEALAGELSALGLPGIQFAATSFTPTASTFAGERCEGIRLAVTDRDAFDPVRAGIGIALALRRLQPAEWDFLAIDRLLANESTLRGIREGLSLREIEAGYRKGLDAFLERRARYLLYP